jgi:hypothetical protein
VQQQQTVQQQAQTDSTSSRSRSSRRAGQRTALLLPGRHLRPAIRRCNGSLVLLLRGSSPMLCTRLSEQQYLSTSVAAMHSAGSR